MYWEFLGHEIDERTMKANIIYKLGNFLISKPDFFYFTIDILISCKGHNLDNGKYDLERIKIRIEQAQIDGSVDADDTECFLELFNEYNGNKNIKKGELLDYIIYKIGPYKLSLEGLNKRTECKILIKGKLCSEKDFDVVFYKEKDIIFAEIIECKLDLNTFIHTPPQNRYSFSNEAKEKLEVMKTIYLNKRENDEISFYLATFRKKIDSCDNVLKAAGFDFVIILNGDNLYELLLERTK